MSYNAAVKPLQHTATDAQIEKPVAVTNSRKSSASFLVSRGVNQATLEDHHGWTRRSRVAARPVSLFADAADDELARVHGLDASDSESDPIGPITWPRCERDTPREDELCVMRSGDRSECSRGYA